MTAETPAPAAAAADTPARRRWASRKFVMACSIIAAGHVALWHRAIGPAEWLELMKWVCGLYLAGNVGATAAGGLGALLQRRAP